MKFLVLLLVLLYAFPVKSQQLSINLTEALNNLQNDKQFKHAIISMYIEETRTGKIILAQNAQTGLAPASCQKIITSTTAFELLGKQYTYKTKMGYDGTISKHTLNGNLYLIGYGDPTLGSWRWQKTKEETFIKNIISGLVANDIKTINGDIVIDDSKWETQATPNGWVWEDVGNYYGAGARGVNWHENQYDLILKPGKKTGDEVAIIATKPELNHVRFINELKTGKEGSGDNSIIYLPENGEVAVVRGTVPAGNETFIVSGSIPNPPQLLAKIIEKILATNKVAYSGYIKTRPDLAVDKKPILSQTRILQTMLSPSFDSINYWFLKKSINLYGEALVKTIAYEKTGAGSADSGIAIIKDFWSNRGIEKPALKILDGSGLSPANRVTTTALVTVLQYATKQNWFASFYNSLPEINGIRMKDGYINGVRAYSGYVKCGNGKEYTFSFIINNFDGSAGTAREKMWKILDLLK
ncbi:MAG: D-alanyl-D-alanine carboxypeptidase/D-alanyl-D-alanine-endopeptidase [Ferruginibacter sp.]